MKKKYMTPAIEVMKLKSNCTLLSGSAHTSGTVNVTYGGTGSDDDSDGFLDDAI